MTTTEKKVGIEGAFSIIYNTLGLYVVIFVMHHYLNYLRNTESVAVTLAGVNVKLRTKVKI